MIFTRRQTADARRVLRAERPSSATLSVNAVHRVLAHAVLGQDNGARAEIRDECRRLDRSGSVFDGVALGRLRPRGEDIWDLSSKVRFWTDLLLWRAATNLHRVDHIDAAQRAIETWLATPAMNSACRRARECARCRMVLLRDGAQPAAVRHAEDAAEAELAAEDAAFLSADVRAHLAIATADSNAAQLAVEEMWSETESEIARLPSAVLDPLSGSVLGERQLVLSACASRAGVHLRLPGDALYQVLQKLDWGPDSTF